MSASKKPLRSSSFVVGLAGNPMGRAKHKTLPLSISRLSPSMAALSPDRCSVCQAPNGTRWVNNVLSQGFR